MNIAAQFLSSPCAAHYKSSFAVRNPFSADALKEIVSASNTSIHEIIKIDLGTIVSVRAMTKISIPESWVPPSYPSTCTQRSLQHT